MENYEKIEVLGRGSFGEVVLVKHKATGKVRGIKCEMKMENNYVFSKTAICS